MKPTHLFLVLFSLGIVSCNQLNENKIESKNSSPNPQEVHFFTADSIKVYADLYQFDLQAPTLVLFHQGGANVHSEYNPIIPKLLEGKYNILAVDLRVGGQLMGNYNRTVADIGVNRFSYCDAYPDMEASLNYLKNNNFTGKTIVWGSSYSAALTIKLAHEHGNDIAAVLAFSPASGEPMSGCDPNSYFESLKTPLLLLRPSSEASIESVKTQLDLANQYGHQTYIALNGRHGSSMLVEERVQAPVSANWNIVTKFINSHAN